MAYAQVFQTAFKPRMKKSRGRFFEIHRSKLINTQTQTERIRKTKDEMSNCCCPTRRNPR